MIFYEKYERQIEPEPNTGCWLWTGELNNKGYGRYHFKLPATKLYVKKLMHKLAYEEMFGPVPLGLELDHLCRQKQCVNPKHLEAVTHAVNVHRALWTEQCRRGHVWTKETTYWRKDRPGTRNCRACSTENDQKRPCGWQRQRNARHAAA